MARHTWTGESLTTDWDDPKNWDSQKTPEDMDEIVIPGYPASKTAGPRVPKEFRAKTLQLNGSGFLSGAKIVVAETFTFAGGSLNCMVDIESGAKLILEGGLDKEIRGITVTNHGTISANGGRIRMSEGAVVHNLSRAECTSSVEWQWVSGAPVSFQNDGILSVRCPLPLSNVAAFRGVSLWNKGTISAESGVLHLVGNEGRHRFLPGSRLTGLPGSGRIRISDYGWAVVEGPVAVDGAGVLEIGTGGSLTNLSNPPEGIVPQLAVGGTLLWTGGTLSATTRLDTVGKLQITGANDKLLSMGLIENYGVIEFLEEGTIQFGGGSRIVNHADLIFRHNALLKYSYGSGGTIENRGNLLLTSDRASSQDFPKVRVSDIAIVSQNLIHLEYGQLRFEQGLFTMKDGAEFAGSGRTVLAGGTMTLEGDAKVNDESTFELTEKGTLKSIASANPMKQLIVWGSFVWTGGTLSGTVAVEVTAGMKIQGDKDKYLSGGLISNEGTIEWSGPGTVSAGGGGSILNKEHGEIRSSENIRLYWSYGASPTFKNEGMIRVTGGVATMDYVKLVNHKNVAIGPGTLYFKSAEYRQLGGEMRLLGGTLGSNGYQAVFEQGVLSGSGTLDCSVLNKGATVSPGYQQETGRLQVTLDYRQEAAAKLDIRINDYNEDGGYSKLIVGTKATLGGELAIRLSESFLPVDGLLFNVLSYMSRTGEFAKTTRPYYRTPLQDEFAHTLLERYDPGAVVLESVSSVLLAERLAVHPSIAWATVHPSGVVDNANARANIDDAALGKPSERSNYGNAPGGSVMLSIRLLTGLTVLARHYTFSVSELAGGSHSAGSDHYQGVAFDVNVINGRQVGATHPAVAAFRQECRNLGTRQDLGPGDPNHETHVHAAWERLDP